MKSYSISLTWAGLVIGVAVECPNGCTEGRSRRPKLHHHGWTPLRGTDGGDKVAHCGTEDGHGYRLYWPGGVPADVTAALIEQQNEQAVRRAS